MYWFSSLIDCGLKMVIQFLWVMAIFFPAFFFFFCIFFPILLNRLSKRGTTASQQTIYVHVLLSKCVFSYLNSNIPKSTCLLCSSIRSLKARKDPKKTWVAFSVFLKCINSTLHFTYFYYHLNIVYIQVTKVSLTKNTQSFLPLFACNNRTEFPSFLNEKETVLDACTLYV